MFIKPAKNLTIRKYNYSQADWEGLRAHLQQAPLLSALQGSANINSVWRAWRGVFLDAVRHYIPLHTIVIRQKNKTWMNSYLHRLSRNKLRLFHRAQRTKVPEDWRSYKSFRNHCNAEFTRYKSLYYLDLQHKITQVDSGGHCWWKVVKQAARITDQCPPIQELASPSGEIVTSDVAKANVLAAHFAKQCSDTSLPTRPTSSPHPTTPLPADHPSFSFPLVGPREVTQVLQSLSPHKSSGCPLITNRILRESAAVIADSLVYIYNLSLTSGVFPRDWKHATVCPVYKNRGEQSDPANYRPISLLPAVAKVLDKLQSRALCRYLVRNNLISDKQFGFLPRRSTTAQLVYLIDEWLRGLDEKKSVSVVFMDFYKAFDRVWHEGLLYKLRRCGLTPSAIAWLTSYISHRTMSVRVGHEFSESAALTAGVPQGSHLGPVLFLVFINDLPSCVPCQSTLYADDALEYVIDTPANPGCVSLQESIDCTQQWADSWHGHFSAAKTEAMLIGAPVLADLNLTMDSNPVRQVKQHTHLGVILSSTLDWSNHVQEMIRRASRRCGLLRHMSRNFTPAVVSHLYISFVRPIFEYACQLWHGSISADLAMTLERLQAGVARTILSADWNTPKCDLLRSMNWPSLRWRRTILSMTMLHHILYMPNSIPPLSKCAYPFMSSLSNRSRRKPLQLLLPKVRTTRYQHSFFYYTAKLWNSLPHSIQSIKQTCQFKRALEAHWQTFKFNPARNIPHNLCTIMETPEIRA